MAEVLCELRRWHAHLDQLGGSRLVTRRRSEGRFGRMRRVQLPERVVLRRCRRSVHELPQLGRPREVVRMGSEVLLGLHAVTHKLRRLTLLVLLVSTTAAAMTPRTKTCSVLSEFTFGASHTNRNPMYLVWECEWSGCLPHVIDVEVIFYDLCICNMSILILIPRHSRAA